MLGDFRALKLWGIWRKREPLEYGDATLLSYRLLGLSVQHGNCNHISIETFFSIEKVTVIINRIVPIISLWEATTIRYMRQYHCPCFSSKCRASLFGQICKLQNITGQKHWPLLLFFVAKYALTLPDGATVLAQCGFARGRLKCTWFYFTTNNKSNWRH